MNDLKGLAKSMGIITPSWARDDEPMEFELDTSYNYPAVADWKNKTRQKTAKHFKKTGVCDRCEIETATDFHHLDYERYDLFVELCSVCHGIEHRIIKDSIVESCPVLGMNGESRVIYEVKTKNKKLVFTDVKGIKHG